MTKISSAQTNREIGNYLSCQQDNGKAITAAMLRGCVGEVHGNPLKKWLDEDKWAEWHSRQDERLGWDVAAREIFNRQFYRVHEAANFCWLASDIIQKTSLPLSSEDAEHIVSSLAEKPEPNISRSDTFSQKPL